MEFQAYDIAIIPVIVALVAVLGKIGVVSRFLPLCSLLLGIVSGIVYVSPDDLRKGIFIGIVMGLSSIGAFSGVKNTIQKRK